MSVDNSELLMLLGGKKKAKQTIGIAGQQGFGVGAYGGSPADLTAMGLAPMEGCEDPTSDNYGNYIHTNGSVMVFVPAFCYRIGNPAAPSYARDNANALEIRDASEGEGDGWILHRAFIDGGAQKLGFFIDKYICSKDSTGKLAVSVKNGTSIVLHSVSAESGGMPGCKGELSDAITLGRARGEHYSCVTAFQWSAISMLSLAHGQAATSNQFCGWYDANHTTNYPKGNNNGSLGDVDDSSVSWEEPDNRYFDSKTGSGSPFNKTTHNGQNCGVTDVNGALYQVTLGIFKFTSGMVDPLRESVKAHDITIDNRNSAVLYDSVNLGYGDGDGRWGNNAFFTDKSGNGRACCGILPRNRSSSDDGLFGKDYVQTASFDDFVLTVGGACDKGKDAGIWCRSYSKWGDYSWNTTFRISGYAN